MNQSVRRSVLLWAFICPVAQAADWQVDTDASRVGFVATYDGIPFEARFERFTADIRFDPERLSASRFDVRMDISSVNSDSVDRDEGMLDAEWFDSSEHPTASFTADRFRALGDGRFEAQGQLTIKGISREIVLPFTWQASGKTAQLTAETSVKRLDFDIGIGEWKTDGTIGFDVTAQADLKLTR